MSSERDPPRRTFLKATGLAAIGGAASVRGVSLAQASPDADHALGRTQFVELALEHEGLPAKPRVVTDRLLPYVVEDGRLTVAHADPDPLEADAVLATPRGLEPLPAATQRPGSTRQLHAAADYRGLERESVAVAESYEPFDVTLDADGGRLSVGVAGRSLELAPGSERAVELPEQSVEVQRPSSTTRTIENPREDGPDTLTVAEPGPVEPVTVQPTLRVRTHGVVDAYGASDAVLVPAAASDRYGRAAVESAQAAVDGGLDATADDLLVVPTGGDGA
jgi:hypothetical protein